MFYPSNLFPARFGILKKKTFKRVLTKTCHFELKHHKSIKFQNVKVKQCEVHLPSKFALESCDNILKY